MQSEREGAVDLESAWLNTLIAAARPEELPMQAATRHALARVLVNDQGSRRRITEVVMADPALTLRVMQHANAVEHRHFRFEINALEDAIHMIGTHTLIELERQAPLAEDVLDARRLEQYRHSCGCVWLAALLAQDWAEQERDRVPAEIALAALFNDLGKLYLLAHGDARINRYLDMRQHPNVWPHEAEYVTLSFNLESLGYRLAVAWNLPEMVRESMRGRNARHSRPLLAMLATQIARHAFGGWRHPAQWNDLALVAELLGGASATVLDSVDRVLEQFNARALLYTLPPLAALPRPAGQDPQIWRDPPSTPPFCLAPRTDELALATAALTAGTITDRATLIQVWLNGLHRGLGLNRVLYATFDPEQRILTAEQAVGTDFEPNFNRFRLVLDTGGLLAALMVAPQALWFNASPQAARSEPLPVDVKTLTGTESFIVRSVWVRGRPLGLIYADRRANACALDARAYQGLQQLSALAEAALARSDQVPGRRALTGS